ncbi:carbohydrate esterase family 3 protein [Apiospora arundinis]|uniref:Carbohydrate esterase family 3 protein n=1 Tax=Apiospora arundinis TaxID=335852 RepID=A0ABR2JM35_9PEZI
MSPRVLLTSRPKPIWLAAAILITIALFLSLFDSQDVTSSLSHYIPGQTHGGGTEKVHPIAGGIPLRVMFIGASIARGEESTHDVGYRQQLRDWMAAQGNPVNCVGTQRFGYHINDVSSSGGDGHDNNLNGTSFRDDDNEAYGAHRIRDLHEKCRVAVPQFRPNLMLVQIGTSDCWREDDPVNIISRYKDFVRYLLLPDDNGSVQQVDERGNKAGFDATVIMSTLVTTPNKEKERCFFSANAQIRQAALDLQREGLPVVLAEMHYDQGFPNRPRESDIGPDDIHPTDDGYLMMGDIFKEAIRVADQKGFIKRAVENGIPEDGDAERRAEEAAAAQTQALAPAPAQNQAPAEEPKGGPPHQRRA